MPTLLAIDPGFTESGWVLIDMDTHRPLEFGKELNAEVLRRVREGKYDDLAIEQVVGYGMPVGQEVFETVYFAGQLHEAGTRYHLVYRASRREVKLNLCGKIAAKDANIIQALIDKYAMGVPNRGKGTKADPGWFYGFKSDIWQAYALGVTILGGRNEA